MSPQTSNGPKFRRRAEARPDEVLDAALDLFIAQGFAATRVDDIAAAAGISKGAVYLYFPSKVAILEGLVRRAIVPIVENASALATVREGAPLQVLETVIGGVVTRLSDPRNAAIPRLIIGEAGNFPELARMYRTEVVDRAFAMLTGIVRRGIEQGQFRAIDPEIAVRSIVGPIFLNMLMTTMFGFPVSDPKTFADSHRDILLNGLLRQPGAG